MWHSKRGSQTDNTSWSLRCPWRKTHQCHASKRHGHTISTWCSSVSRENDPWKRMIYERNVHGHFPSQTVRLTIAKSSVEIRMNPIKKGWTYHKPLLFGPYGHIWHQGTHWVRLCRMRDMASDIWSAKSLPELDFLDFTGRGPGAPWTKKWKTWGLL